MQNRRGCAPGGGQVCWWQIGTIKPPTMPTMTSERVRLTARIPEHLRDTLEQAAGLQGATLNQFVVQSAFAEAQRVLKAAVARDRENPYAWYQLGVVYAANGDLPRAQLASAEQQIMSGNPRAAMSNARAAEQALPTGSPDWIRAQDVSMQARDLIERMDERD